MHKRLIPQNDSEEQIDQDNYNALVSKLDVAGDGQKQSFKCILEKVHKNHKKEIIQQLKMKNTNNCIFSMRAKLLCKSCNDFRLKNRGYLNRCICGSRIYMSISITNLGAPVKVNIDVNIEDPNFELRNIFNLTRNFKKDENYQNDWQFLQSSNSGSHLVFQTANDNQSHNQTYVSNYTATDEYVYGGDYFSSTGNLTLVCNINVEIFESWHQSSSSKSHLPGTSTILAGMFSDANINPPTPLVNMLTDIVLSVENNKIHCHKLILGMTSKVFERMFNTDMKESKSQEIELKEVGLETIKSMLLFMYRDKIEDEKINVDLLAAADMYEVLRLKNICSIRLGKTIDTRNVAKIWQCAYLHDAEDLAHLSMIYMMRHWEEISKEADVRNLCRKYPDLLFTISTLMAKCQRKE